MMTFPDKSYLINLARRPERMAVSLKQFEKTNITPTVFEAIDGKTVELPNNWVKGQGAYGLWLTALRLLEQNIGNVANLGFFEDDVVFVKDFDQKLADLLMLLPTDWDLLMLGGQHQKDPIKIKPGLVQAVDCHRTHAMIINGKFLEPLYQIWAANPTHIDQSFAKYQGKYKVYCPEQWLAAQGEGVSDINLRLQAERWWQPRVKKKWVPRETAKPTGCNSCSKKKT